MILEGNMHFDQPDISPDDPTVLLSPERYTEAQECKNVCDNKIVILWKLSPSLNQGD